MLRQNASRPAGPLDSLNDPGDVFRNPAQVDFIRRLVELLRAAFLETVRKDTAAAYVHLAAPGGKVFKVSVRDDGTLQTEYIRG